MPPVPRRTTPSRRPAPTTASVDASQFALVMGGWVGWLPRHALQNADGDPILTLVMFDDFQTPWVFRYTHSTTVDGRVASRSYASSFGAQLTVLLQE